MNFAERFRQNVRLLHRDLREKRFGDLPRPGVAMFDPSPTGRWMSVSLDDDGILTVRTFDAEECFDGTPEQQIKQAMEAFGWKNLAA
jgi:hypothetical protein